MRLVRRGVTALITDCARKPSRTRSRDRQRKRERVRGAGGYANPAVTAPCLNHWSMTSVRQSMIRKSMPSDLIRGGNRFSLATNAKGVCAEIML